MPLAFTELSRYDRIAHHLEYGHQDEAKAILEAAQAQPAGHDPVTEWLAARLKHPPANPDWPPVVAAQHLGWQQYYRGDLVTAAGTFADAWRRIDDGEADYGFRPDVALGLGKVYTRTGHWLAARDWLILFLADARRSGDLFAVTKGYGALGELFLRADLGRPALACLNTAFHVLPAGSGQQSRQLNYLASALIRNREWLRAESLLMTGLQNARAMLSAGIDPHEASSSIRHALARLQFLELARHPDSPAEIRTPEAFGADVPGQDAAPVATGMLAAGQALSRWTRGDTAGALIRMDEACRHLRATLPMEHAWALRMLGAMAGQDPDFPEDARQLMAVHPLASPKPKSVLDRTWRDIPLRPDNGFAALACRESGIGQLAGCWRLFFL